MDLSLPDPITNYNRQVARQRYLRREEHVMVHHPGFNLVYWQRIVRVSDRVERWGRRRGWTRDQIMLTKALLISRMACVFIDHLIRRMQQVRLIPPSTLDPRQEWESQYRHFLMLFLGTPEVPDREEIVALMQRLHRYIMPPESLLTFRRRHWKWIEGVLRQFLVPTGPSDLFIRRQVDFEKKPVVAARRICFTAALYSDIQERLYGQQWMYAYSDCMLRLYDQLRKAPDILTAIICLR